jgi:hypothetical protein
MSSVAVPSRPEPGAAAPPSAARAAAWGLLVTAVQVLLACLSSGRADPARAYAELINWDGVHYQSVVAEGYHSPLEPTAKRHGNVGFFPGYPVAAAAVMRLTGLPLRLALPLTAQLCCWGFWTYLLLLCRRWGVPPRLALWGVLLLAAQPAAFFLVAAYSESLFLMTTLGFIYWSERRGPAAAALAALHGFAMTATRLVGLPVVVYPLASLWLQADWRRRGALADVLRRSAGPLLVGAVAALGVASYFVYCQIQFGRWDLYIKTQEAAWYVKPYAWALFSPRIFEVGLPELKRGVDPDFLSRAATLFLVLAFAALPALEVWRATRRGDGSWRGRAALYLAAFLLFWGPLCGYWWDHFRSMIRYALPVLVLLVLAVLHGLARRGVAEPGPRVRLLLGAWAAVSVCLQLALAFRYTHDHWVA